MERTSYQVGITCCPILLFVDNKILINSAYMYTWNSIGYGCIKNVDIFLPIHLL